MELTDAMRTTHACRRYLPDPVPDEVLHRAFDAARFAPKLGFSDPLRAHEESNSFAHRFGEHPLIIIVCVDPSLVHPTDLDLDRLSIVGGASVYPMAQNLCLALRDQGVASTFTTLLVAYEPQVKELLGVPDPYVTACHIVAGYPERGFPTKLRRRPVEELVFVDTFGEQPPRVP